MKVLDAIKNGKVLEFYMHLFNETFEVLNESFTVSRLFTSQSQVVITLIERKDKEKRLIRNWRHISLINVDNKILSQVLASRIKES